jgi:nitroreductase
VQTWDAITSRRNVRAFDGRPIPAADLDRILEAGRRSPSSQNWQPWDFIVVTDRAQLRELARVWRGAGHVAGSAATIVVIAPAADNEFGRAQFDLGQATMSQNGPSGFIRPLSAGQPSSWASSARTAAVSGWAGPRTRERSAMTWR